MNKKKLTTKVLKKHLGQHFLSDDFYLEKIVQSFAAKKHDVCIEIGPGAGVLTKMLVDEVKHLYAVEIDGDLYEHLEALFADKKFTLIKMDILAFKPDQYFSKDKKYRWIGNLPYNISTAFFINLIQWRQWFHDGLFMIQKEVADRLLAKPGDGSYGRLTVALAPYFTITHVLDVPPEAFSPPPKVDSTVVAFQINTDEKNVVSKGYHQLIATAFQKRRKMLRSVMGKKMSEEDWHHVGIASTDRAEMLSYKQFMVLAEFLDKKK